MSTGSMVSLSNRSITSSGSESGGFYGKKNNTSKKKKTKTEMPSSTDKPPTTIDEPEFYPPPRSEISDNNNHPKRKYQTSYMVPSPLVYDVSVTAGRTTTSAPMLERSYNTLWPCEAFAKTELRPSFSPSSVDCSPGPAYLPEAKHYRDGRDGTPHWSLNGRQRDLTRHKTPGPGAYNPESVGPTAKPRAPQYSFGDRTCYYTAY